MFAYSIASYIDFYDTKCQFGLTYVHVAIAVMVKRGRIVSYMTNMSVTQKLRI